jgi:hypothetical protein
MARTFNRLPGIERTDSEGTISPIIEQEIKACRSDLLCFRFACFFLRITLGYFCNLSGQRALYTVGRFRLVSLGNRNVCNRYRTDGH